MKVFAIVDFHLSGQPPTKPMTIFGPHWDNHWERIQAHWREHIEPDDLVFLVGDMSWAMRLSDAKVDLDTIATLPGKKFMIVPQWHRLRWHERLYLSTRPFL